MKAPRASIDQWRTLQAVVDKGGYAQAAKYLNRSQSSVSYAIRRLEDQLETDILVVKGRKAELTEAGKILLQRSRLLVDDAHNIEQLASDINQGRETEIRLVVDEAFPFATLIHSLQQFHLECGNTRILLEQVVMSGADELLANAQADLAICHHVPADMLGDEIMQIEFIAVAHPAHALHQFNQPITINQLQDEMQVVIRDSGTEQQRDRGWLGAEQQWSVPSIESSLKLVCNGMGYGWLPRHMICEHLKNKTLQLLPLREGQSYTAELSLVFGKRQLIGPATQQLADILRHNIDTHA